MNNRKLAETLLSIVLIAAVAILVLKAFFDIDALDLTRGFLSWLYDMIWGNRAYRRA